MNGWDVRPTLDRANANRRPLAQAAGSFVAGSPLPQALIQCRQRLTYELRLGKLVIPCRGQHRSLWQTTRRWPSPRRPLHRPRPRQNGPGTRRHATFRARPHSAHIIAYRAACMYAPVPRDLISPPQVAPPSRSKMALNSRSVPGASCSPRTGHALGAVGEEPPGTGGVIRFPARFDLLYASAPGAIETMGRGSGRPARCAGWPPVGADCGRRPDRCGSSWFARGPRGGDRHRRLAWATRPLPKFEPVGTTGRPAEPRPELQARTPDRDYLGILTGLPILGRRPPRVRMGPP